MAAKAWPATLWPSRVMFDIEGQSDSGGRSSDGSEQTVISSAGRVVAKLFFKALQRSRPDETLAARAVKAHMRGRANTILVGPFDAPYGPAGLNGEALGPFDTPHDDDVLFDDDTGYDQLETPAEVAAAAIVGAAALTVRMTAGHFPQPGQWFGLKDKEIHLIADATDQGGDVWLLEFTPTLRYDAVVGEAVNFDRPLCEMKSTADLFGELNFEKYYQADFEIELVESPP